MNIRIWYVLLALFKCGFTQVGDTMDGFPSYIDYVEYLQSLSESDLVQVDVIGQTLQNEDIQAITVSDYTVSDTKYEMIVISGLNAEPITLKQVLYTIQKLTSDFEAGNEEIQMLLKTTKLYFLPLVNADAYKYLSDVFDTQDFDGWNPKNSNQNWQNDAVSSGVNLANNFPYQWGYDEEGSSLDPCQEDYRGASAASEPETKAVVDFFQSISPALGIVYASPGLNYEHPYSYTIDEELEAEHIKIYKGIWDVVPEGYTWGTRGQLFPTSSNGSLLDYLYSQGTISLQGNLGNSTFSMSDEDDNIEEENYLTFLDFAKLLYHSFEIAVYDKNDELWGEFYDCEDPDAYSTIIVSYMITNNAIGESQPLSLSIELDYNEQLSTYGFNLTQIGLFVHSIDYHTLDEDLFSSSLPFTDNSQDEQEIRATAVVPKIPQRSYALVTIIIERSKDLKFIARDVQIAQLKFEIQPVGFGAIFTKELTSALNIDPVLYSQPPDVDDDLDDEDDVVEDDDSNEFGSEKVAISVVIGILIGVILILIAWYSYKSCTRKDMDNTNSDRLQASGNFLPSEKFEEIPPVPLVTDFEAKSDIVTHQGIQMVDPEEIQVVGAVSINN